MAKIYATPDFDVTSYDINDILTVETGSGDPDWNPSDPKFGELEGWD